MAIIHLLRSVSVTLRELKQLVKWGNMPCFEQYLIGKGIDTTVELPDEQYFALQKEYNGILKFRIDYCKQLLKKERHWIVCWCIAELCWRRDVDLNKEILMQQETIQYTEMGLRMNPTQWRMHYLMAKIYHWLSFIENSQKDQITCIEKAIKFSIKALSFKPNNEEIKQTLKKCSNLRNI